MRLNRGTIGLLILSLAIIGLALAVLNAPAEAPGTVETSEEGVGPLFPDITAEDVTRFEVVDLSADAQTVMVKDEQDVWALEGETLEQGASVDQTEIVGSVDSFIDTEVTETFTEVDDLAPFGLDEPTHRFSLTAKGETTTLAIGRQNPSGSRYYALLNDDAGRVLLVNQTFQIDNLKLLATDKPIQLPPTPTPVPELSVPGPLFPNFSAPNTTVFEVRDNRNDEAFIAATDEDVAWLIEAPVSEDEDEAVEPDQAAISLAVSAFAGLRSVDGFSEADPANFGLAQPRYTITATTFSGQSFTLQLGDEDRSGTRYYAQVDGFPDVVEVPREAVDSLLDLIAEPPYVPAAEITPEATAEATAEAASE